MDMKADVIVVGAGGAGIMAAIAAVDAGARVMQLEKMPSIGGCWASRGGTTAGARTKIQFDAGIFEDSPDLFYDDCLRDRSARQYCDPEILKFYCRQAGAAVDWLDSLGAYPTEMRRPRQGIYGENWTVERCYVFFQPFMKVVRGEYEKRLAKGGIELHTRTKVTQLLRAQGRINGVRAKSSGEMVDFRAPSVIICSGGFGRNITLLRKYNLPTATMIMSIAPAFDTGDGLVLCEEVGARLVNLDQPPGTGCYLGGIPDPGNPERPIAHVDMDRYPGTIWVDNNGKRVVNEDCGANMPAAMECLYNSPGQTLHIILDQRTRQEQASILTKWFTIPGREWEWFDARAEEGIIIKKAGTISQLGEKLGINPEDLTDTVKRWNDCVEKGEDIDFGRQELANKIETPPYYGITTGSTVIASSGGPAVSIHQQVLDNMGKAIPGLYAAGEVAGYQGHGTGKFNMGNIIFGKLAGRMAALEALSLRH